MKTGKLIYSSTAACADLLYATEGFDCGDPFLWIEANEQKYIFASTLEYTRACEQSSNNTVFNLAQWQHEKGYNGKGIAQLIAFVSKEFGVNEWQVPYSFPSGLFIELQKVVPGVNIIPTSSLFPQRAIKSAFEIEKVRNGVRLAETGMYRAFEILKESVIDGDQVIWSDTVLTSETLIKEIDSAIRDAGGNASHTIAASGSQGASPHNHGSGPIKPHTPIVIDIFPRDESSGYHGDLTRTVVKGEASDIVKKAFEAVKVARDTAKASIKNGVKACDIHNNIVKYFDEQGFETSTTGEAPRGFFHGTGHGLGLEVHEAPGVGAGDNELLSGHVITVEPGLYYPEWGGIRLEDVVAINEDGCEELTEIDTFLEIK